MLEKRLDLNAEYFAQAIATSAGIEIVLHRRPTANGRGRMLSRVCGRMQKRWIDFPDGCTDATPYLIDSAWVLVARAEMPLPQGATRDLAIEYE